MKNITLHKMAQIVVHFVAVRFFIKIPQVNLEVIILDRY